ncbi:hypothetical protein GHT06_013357 [Daphnia sinensis]|uniref:Uncharacterized protein n=1 Tax=Daphnia sinensis TaxID=1820382 RepID=A0AAD5KXS6_9CRUS|nr:hypothetical protein GHT06_013357 [Daphnia sinensis]
MLLLFPVSSSRTSTSEWGATSEKLELFRAGESIVHVDTDDDGEDNNVQKTEVIITDKDCAEIGAAKEIFVNAKHKLCHFHALGCRHLIYDSFYRAVYAKSQEELEIEEDYLIALVSEVVQDLPLPAIGSAIALLQHLVRRWKLNAKIRLFEGKQETEENYEEHELQQLEAETPKDVPESPRNSRPPDPESPQAGPSTDATEKPATRLTERKRGPGRQAKSKALDFFKWSTKPFQKKKKLTKQVVSTTVTHYYLAYTFN